MNHLEFVLFLSQISVMIVAALICGNIAKRLGQLPVFGELFGGIILGPTVFGAMAPDAYQWLFPATGAACTARQALIKLGLLFFLLVAGLEVDLGALRRRGLCVVLVSILGMAVPFALGFGMVVFMPNLVGCQVNGSPLFMACFMGTALSISALPVIARILMDLRLIRQEIGCVVMSSAIVNDLIGWFLFGLILANAPAAAAGSHGLSAGWLIVPVLFVLFLTVGRWISKRWVAWLRLHTTWPSSVIATSMLIVLTMGAVFEWLGSHATIVAFLVGVALAPAFEDADRDRETVSRFVVGFFCAPLYFVSVGLSANFVKGLDPLLVFVVLVVACVGKIGGAGLGAWLGRARPREALAIGFGMNARGVIEIVLASIALETGIIGERVFVALVIMALATSLLSGPVMKRLLSRDAGCEMAARKSDKLLAPDIP